MRRLLPLTLLVVLAACKSPHPPRYTPDGHRMRVELVYPRPESGPAARLFRGERMTRARDHMIKILRHDGYEVRELAVAEQFSREPGSMLLEVYLQGAERFSQRYRRRHPLEQPNRGHRSPDGRMVYPDVHQQPYCGPEPSRHDTRQHRNYRECRNNRGFNLRMTHANALVRITGSDGELLLERPQRAGGIGDWGKVSSQLSAHVRRMLGEVVERGDQRCGGSPCRTR